MAINNSSAAHSDRTRMLLTGITSVPLITRRNNSAATKGCTILWP